MHKRTNYVSAVMAAAIAGAMAVIMTGGAPAEPAPPLDASLVQANPEARESACLLQGWPNYARHCQFDLRAGGHTGAAIVRVIALR
jgi:hypothetical protein